MAAETGNTSMRDAIEISTANLGLSTMAKYKNVAK